MDMIADANSPEKEAEIIDSVNQTDENENTSFSDESEDSMNETYNKMDEE